MRKKIVLTALAALSVLAALDGTDAARRGPSLAAPHGREVFLRFGNATAIPGGYYRMCRERPSLCRRQTARGMATTGGGAIVLTDSAMAQLGTINLSVNRSMKAAADGGRDRWSAGDATGDCEDYALTKKQRLLRLGWPSSALLIALARTGGGEEHAVLVARTDRGDLVLDNLRSDIRPWNQVSYSWRMIQSPTRTWAWNKLR